MAALHDWARKPLLRLRARGSPRHSIAGIEFAEADLKVEARSWYWRDRALLHRMWSPSTSWSYPRIASGPETADLRGPMVLATFHVGTLVPLGALFDRLPDEVLVMLTGSMPTRAGVETINVGGGEWARIRATKAGVEMLRSGGFVFLAADWIGNARLRASLFGTTISLPSGAFALARLGNAPILPVTARWHGRSIRIVYGDPISPGPEVEMASRLLQWLERHLRENPGELTWPMVGLLRRGR